MKIVAGLNLKNLNPRVWDPKSEHYLPDLKAVMVSYADFDKMPARRKAAMDQGLRAWLGVPEGIDIYLDNGAFYFLSRDGKRPVAEYEEFVNAANPDWYPMPEEYIPTPMMSPKQQKAAYENTLAALEKYSYDGFVPVAHVGKWLKKYVKFMQGDEQISAKPYLGLGGIVPNLLRAPKAIPYEEVLQSLIHFRHSFPDKHIHVFGMGGTATVHLAALMGFDSIDSSGWRNRAARGIIQLPGTGDRLASDLGKWRGRHLSPQELENLETCACPSCRGGHFDRLALNRLEGFSWRATHNLWVLLKEREWVYTKLQAGKYAQEFRARLDNSIYLSLVERSMVLAAKR